MGEVVSQAFWKNKRVFLTGHTGFKGSWLSLWLSHMGAEVYGYALAPETSPNLFETLRLQELVDHTVGDVRDLPAVKAALDRSRAEVVIHMAAQPLVLRSYEEPVETYATNVMGTVNLLEAVRFSTTVRSVVVVTTDKCYENREWHWGYRESDAMGGYDPYSSSKGCTELVVSAYRRSFLMRPGAQSPIGVASARAGNVIGGGDWSKDRLVPDIINALMNGRRPSLRNPASVRPWQHVLEPLRGYLTLAEEMAGGRYEFAEAWNFGPSDADHAPVLQVAERLTERLGGTGVDCEAVEQPHEAHMLKLDCSKARSQLGWIPQWNLDYTLTRIADWYSAYRDSQDMRAVTLSQIVEYDQNSDRRVKQN